MDKKTKEVFSEVYAFLEIIGEEYIEKIPKKIINEIEKQKSDEYKPIYSSEIAIENQNLQKETLSIIAILDLNYWSSPNEKIKIREKINKNEKKHQLELREKYNPDDLFKNKKNNEKQELIQKLTTNNVNSMIIYNKEGFAKSIINRIKNFFGNLGRNIYGKNN